MEKGVAAYDVKEPVSTGLSWRAFTRVYGADRLGFLSSMQREHGPVVRLAANLVFVSDPALVEAVLRGTNGEFQLSLNRRLETVGAVRGDEVLEAWMRARRRTVSLLHETTGWSTKDAMDLEAQITAWIAAGRVTGAGDDLARLNVRSVMRLMVGHVDDVLEARLNELLAALTVIVDKGTGLSRLAALMSARHRRARRGERDLADAMTRVAASAPEEAVAARLLAAEIDEATVLNLSTAMMLAGALVPAAAGAWILALLGTHRQWQERAHADPVARSAVISEALRLYPPTWLLSRTVACDGVYSGWSLRGGRRGRTLALCQSPSARGLLRPVGVSTGALDPLSTA